MTDPAPEDGASWLGAASARKACRPIQFAACFCALSAAILIALRAHAQTENPPQAVEITQGVHALITLTNGDLVRGVIVNLTEESVELDHALLGRLVIPRNQIAKVEGERRVIDGASSPPAAPGAQPAAPEPGVPPADAATVASPASQAQIEKAQDQKPDPALEEKPTSTWDSDFELGLSGTTGTTERTNLRFNFNGLWKRPEQTLSLRSSYLYNIQDDDRTQNRFTAQGRNEWNIDKGRWRAFAELGIELDEFRDYDYRLSGGGGVGYKWFMEEKIELLTRFGVGGSREFGGPNEDLRPELILGGELRWNFLKNQTITASVEAFPDLQETGEYRATARGAWELRLSQAANLSLRVGIEHRIDTMDRTGDETETDYFAAIVLKF